MWRTPATLRGGLDDVPAAMEVHLERPPGARSLRS
jgi:hypothetical protein